ncbi:hypothetical protein ACVWZA_004216 [Sphingomonas sp. UYAg733]
MNPGLWLRLLPAFLAVFASAEAQAGPWTMPAGDGRVIVTAIYSHADKTFDGNGDARNAPVYDQYQAYFQAEYGLTDDLTLLLAPSLRRVTVENGDSSTGLGYTELGARYKLLDRNGLVFSLQGTAFIPGVKRRDVVAQIGSTDPQYDARAQVGYGFKIGKTDAFISADGGYRYRAGDQPNEIHSDVTFGVHATKRLMFIANSYNTWSDGRGRNIFPSYRYSNIYAGGVYDLSDRVSLQLGGLATVSGRNALRERGIYTGLWVRF